MATVQTRLKWPNSITLLEAFRIRDGKISRIEAVFTYVPYFMPNPFRDPPAEAPKFKIDPRSCNAACLEADARKVAAAMVGNNWRSVPWASAVGYAENSVGLRVGEGIWATVTAADPAALVVAGASTGKSVWIGRIEEHGQPAWAALTVSGAGDRVTGIDALIRRKEYGAPYAEPARAPSYDTLPAARRTSRAAMEAGAERLYTAVNSHGPAPAGLAANCTWLVNGQGVGACAPAFANPGLEAIARVRDRSVLAADEARGLIVYRTFEDLPAKGSGYPLTYQVIELFRFDGGQIAEVQAFTSELPYGMKPHQ